MSGSTSGILLVDKPGGVTSHDVVSSTRKALGTRKVGHAGTLDPMATGLLILGANSATRLLTFLVGLDKEYLATIRLGAGSTTDDAEGELGVRADAASLAATDEASIAAASAELTGAIGQRPSAVSAIKVDGRRAYARVRAGEDVVLPERPVTVSAFDVLTVRRSDWVDVDVRVECSSGTYVRALARDLGAALGVGGHLTALRRTRVGPFTVDEAGDALLAPATVAARLFPTARLEAAAAAELAVGKSVAVADARGPIDAAGPIAALGPDGRLIGLIRAIDGRSRVLVNFPPDEVLR